MAKRLIYTRAYSKKSAGKLVSAKGTDGDRLSEEGLVVEFRNHAQMSSRVRTSLISFCGRIVDTVKHAFERNHNGESPDNTWVAVIEVPATMNEKSGKLHAARRLVIACNLSEVNVFEHLLRTCEEDMRVHMILGVWALTGWEIKVKFQILGPFVKR